MNEEKHRVRFWLLENKELANYELPKAFQIESWTYLLKAYWAWLWITVTTRCPSKNFVNFKEGNNLLKQEIWLNQKDPPANSDQKMRRASTTTMLWVFASVKRVPVWQNQKVMLFSKFSAWNSKDLLSLTVNASQVLRDIFAFIKSQKAFWLLSKVEK